MAAEWFYSNDGDRLGPVTASELRELAAQGQLQPTSLIWKAGMEGWAPAAKIKDITFATVAPAVPPPLPTSLGAVDPVPVGDGDFSFPPVPRPASIPSKKGMSVRALALVGVGSAFVFGIAVWLLLNSGPSATREGQSWSHTELIQHLKGKGLKFEAKPTHRGGVWGPAMSFEFNGDEVYVQIRKSAQEAKDQASTGGEKVFAWGRFIFAGEPKRLSEFKKALHADHQTQQNSKTVIAKPETEIAKKEAATRRHIQECRWWWKKPSDAELDGLIDLIVSTNSGNYVIIDDLGQNEVVSTAWSPNWWECTTQSLRTRRCCVTVSGSRRTTKEEALNELQAAVDRAEFKNGPAPERVPVAAIKWQRFAHPKGVASIDMPGVATIDNSQKATATFTFRDMSIVYELTVAPLPEFSHQARVAKLDALGNAFDAFKKSLVRRNLSAVLISGEDIQLGETRGNELRTHADFGVNVSRIYVHNGRVIEVGITFPFEAELTKQEMGRFFDSLKLTGDAVAVGGDVVMPNAAKAKGAVPEVVDAVPTIPKKPASIELPMPVAMVPEESRTNAAEIVSKSTGMKLALIPAGTFTMGSPDSEVERVGDEGPLHAVRISQPFYMGIHEVTQREYEMVIQTNPSWFSKNGDGSREVKGRDTSQFPVENMSWYDAVEFCNELSVRDRLPKYYTLTNSKRGSGSIKSAGVSVAGGDGYRLPTEAEWEYACRANSTTPFHFGSTSDGSEANVNGSVPYGRAEMGVNLKCTTKVGSYKQNALGLFDMHGNVREWCGDAYNKKPYSTDSSGTTIDPNETTGESYRVLRGGSWHSSSGDARAARRLGGADFGRDGSSGFRTVRSISPTDASGKTANLGRSADVAVDTGELKGETAANHDGNAKPAAAEPLPDEFRTYFERADERKAELIMAAEAKIALKEIEVRGATPKSKAARKRELSDLEEALRDLKKSKPFDFMVENRDMKQTRETHTIGVLGSCAVQAVIDEHTIVANCWGGAGGQGFTAVLKMDSTKGIRANSKLTPSDVWQVTSADGLEDEAVALLLNRSGAVRGKVKVLKVVKKGELEKHRATYEAAKKAAVKP